MEQLCKKYAKITQKLREKKLRIICIIMHPLLNHHDDADGGEGQQLTSGRLGCFI